MNPQRHPNWDHIDTVMLDMDGTLLDRYFDDYFWLHHLPEVYAAQHALPFDQAKEHLLTQFKSVECTLQWTNLLYWSERLGLDILQLKRDIASLIGILDGACEFLSFVRKLGKKLVLVTNAHPLSLQLKLEKTEIEGYFDTIISAEEVGAAKEEPIFWQNLKKIIPFTNEGTLFADDTERVLQTAAGFGIGYLVHIARPSTKLSPHYSENFFSIHDFSQICRKD